jgi:GNAT superfamily N-acetyltransferase
VTRTSEELSVICSERAVPEAATAERGWRCLKVDGRLSFELTGILSALTRPLADAAVPVFAISTYDTDYLLVKEDRLTAAYAALEREGHVVGPPESEAGLDPDAPSSDAADVTITRAGSERIDDLEPLWAALQQHHAFVAPTLAGLPARSVQDSWRRRRAKYEAWLSEPDAFVLLAERFGQEVGYALVTVGEPYQGWGSAERVAQVETLAVLDAERGRGLGTQLMDAVERELAQAGIHELRLAVVPPNSDALRFYARRGLEPVAVTFFGRLQAAGSQYNTLPYGRRSE